MGGRRDFHDGDILDVGELDRAVDRTRAATGVTNRGEGSSCRAAGGIVNKLMSYSYETRLFVKFTGTSTS
jgi:hypothetical protein